VASVVRPPWLDAVTSETGVVESSLPDALRRYAGAVRAPAPAPR
jgi:hypothetical protein